MGTPDLQTTGRRGAAGRLYGGPDMPPIALSFAHRSTVVEEDKRRRTAAVPLRGARLAGSSRPLAAFRTKRYQ
jgi:hypothetical protein